MNPEASPEIVIVASVPQIGLGNHGIDVIAQFLGPAFCCPTVHENPKSLIRSGPTARFYGVDDMLSHVFLRGGAA